MPGHGRTIGIILLAVALIACLIATALLITQAATHETTVTGAILGILIAAVVFVLPLGGGGLYLLTKGRQESAEYAEIARQKKILNMVLAQGKVALSQMKADRKCPNCGGQVELVGKSVIKCPFCGSEVFLAS